MYFKIHKLYRKGKIYGFLQFVVNVIVSINFM